MDKDYLEIVSRNILSDIKDKLRINGVVLEEKQEKFTDEKMIEIIKSVVENDYKFMHKKKMNLKKMKKMKSLIFMLCNH